MLYAQASNTFITPQTYQKWSGDLILGNTSRYYCVYKLQDKTEDGFIKTALISSVSHFNLGVETLFVGLKPKEVPRGDGTEFWASYVASGKLADICLIRIVAYSG